MRIAFVYDAIYPWIKGGVERRLYEIGKRLATKHEVWWFGLKWWDGTDRELDRIHIHGVGRWRNYLYVHGRRSIEEGIYFGFKTLIGLKGNFDLIDCQEFPYFSCFSSKIHSITKGSSLIITWHEVWRDYWFEYLGKKGFFGWIAEKLVSKLTNRNIAVSERTRRNLEKMGVKAEVIPNGIDFKLIQETRRNDEESDIIFVGRLTKEKNVDLLIRSVKLLKMEIPDIKCVIIGDGPEKESLKILSKNLGVSENIIFKGFLDNHADVISRIKASKLFVLPSSREGFGIVALEANACGLPVITVKHERNAACDLIIDNMNGFICLPSAEEIAEKVEWAAQRNMSKGCVENAKRYDWDKIVNSYEHFLNV